MLRVHAELLALLGCQRFQQRSRKRAWRLRDNHRGRGPSLEINGRTLKPAPEYLVLATTDAYPKVADHYGTKLGFSVVVSQFEFSGCASSTSSDGGWHLAFVDNQDIGPPNHKIRPVRVLCLRKSCGSYNVIVFITRVEKEAHTHVVVFYDPKGTS
jgi:hypothetical protein